MSVSLTLTVLLLSVSTSKFMVFTIRRSPVCGTATLADDWLDSTPTLPGVVAEARAVLFTVPASTSAWVTTYVALQLTVTPGATAPGGQVMADKPTCGSEMLSALRVTFPVFVTAN